MGACQTYLTQTPEVEVPMTDSRSALQTWTPVERLDKGATIYQRGTGSYALDYRPNGRRSRPVLPGAKTLTQARKQAYELLRKNDIGEAVTPSTLTLDQLAENFFESFSSMVTSGERSGRSLDDYRRRYRTHISPRIGHVRVQQLTRARALSLLDELRASGAASATVQASWKALVTVVNHGRDLGIASVDLKVPRQKRVRVRNKRQVKLLTPSQVADVVDFTAPRWRLLVLTASLTGARVSELLGLQWADINLDPQAASISITKQLDRTGKLV